MFSSHLSSHFISSEITSSSSGSRMSLSMYPVSVAADVRYSSSSKEAKRDYINNDLEYYSTKMASNFFFILGKSTYTRV